MLWYHDMFSLHFRSQSCFTMFIFFTHAWLHPWWHENLYFNSFFHFSLRQRVFFYLKYKYLFPASENSFLSGEFRDFFEIFEIFEFFWDFWDFWDILKFFEIFFNFNLSKLNKFKLDLVLALSTATWLFLLDLLLKRSNLTWCWKLHLQLDNFSNLTLVLAF